MVPDGGCDTLMMHSTLARRGAYANLWSHLKSFDNALARALSIDSDALQELDRERLIGLSEFIRSGIEPRDDAEIVNVDSMLSADARRSGYAGEFDLRSRFKNIHGFESWHAAARMGVDEKIQRLVKALEVFATPPKGQVRLVRTEPPRQEFEILRSLVRDLMRDPQLVAR